MEDKETCIAIQFWDNGHIKYEEFLNLDNSTTLKNYDSAGKLLDETGYNEDNFKHGICKKYFSNGFLKSEELYQHGQIQLQKVYNQYGQILSADYYQDGELAKRVITMIGVIEF